MEEFERLRPDEVFLQEVHDVESRLFPEFAQEDIYSPKGIPYFYFAPSWHIKYGLLTKDDVDMLRGNKRKLLSVGAGSAYLERLLVELGVAQESIVLADKNADVMPSQFNRATFDMYEEWPDFDTQKFDRIIFPESVLLNMRSEKNEGKRNALRHIITSSLSRMTSDGVMSINGHSQEAGNVGEVIQQLQEEGHSISAHYDDLLLKVKKEPTAIRNIQLETAARKTYWIFRV